MVSAAVRHACLLLVPLAFGAGRALAAPPAAGVDRQPVPLAAPGTVVGDPAAPRWNRVVLMASSRITAGDVESIPEAVRERIPQSTLVLLATVRQVAGPDGRPRHELAELGVGYALPVGGRLTVVDTDAPPAAAGIDFFGRQILSQNGKALTGLSLAGGTETVRIFDVEAILLRGGRHVDCVMRHFVWVEPASGLCSACVWLLEPQPGGGLALADDPPRWIAPDTREDRAIHVDATEFTLGIPTRRAFAMVDLPPGRPLPWSPALRAAAAAAAYAPDDVRALAVELDRSLQTLRTAQRPAQ